MKKTIINLSLVLSLSLLFSSNTFAKNLNEFKFSYVHIIILFIIFIFISMLASIQRTKKINEKSERTNQILHQIIDKDATWNEDELLNNAKNTFYGIMNGLANNDFEDLKKIVHPNLYTKWETQFEKFKDCSPVNMLNNNIKDVKIVDINNFIDNEKDNYTVKIEYIASEYVVDKSGNLICDNYNEEDEKTAMGQMTEYWKFEREGSEWMLAEAFRSNKWKKYINDKIVNEN